MKRKYIITALVAILIVGLMQITYLVMDRDHSNKPMNVGLLYVGDSCNVYTQNFINAQKQLELIYGKSVHFITKYNVSEDVVEPYIQELVDADCKLIFGTSYGYETSLKKYAEKNPDIEFCMLTGDNAASPPVLSNYHTAMGQIYQGRYISGVVAGMKMQEMIDQGELSADDVKIGYVGAFPYAEVISGYTAFFMGVRSVVPTATMTVCYTNSWGDYELEKTYAKKLIEDGCVIISQHSDTAGPAVACEEAIGKYNVYHAGYNWSMIDVAPTTSLIGCRINWLPYLSGAIEAVKNHRSIEKCVDGNVHGTDVSAGFDRDWVQMFKLNEIIAADGTNERINELIREFEKGEIDVYKGNYIGIDPYDKTDICDLRNGYQENETQSAPSFHYVLKDVITIMKEMD